MPRIEPFEHHPDQYDRWFERHPNVYDAEVRALQALMPPAERGVEIGVGTGRFAQALGIEEGVDPSPTMRRRAEQRGIRVRDGTAEHLPYADGQFDVALLVTTICFVDELEESLAKAHRVLRPSGALLVGMVDRERPLGRQYVEKKESHPFYHAAHFHTTTEAVQSMRAVGFADFAFRQTLFRPLDVVGPQEPVTEGYGDGSFVVIRGRKQSGSGERSR